MLIPLKGFIIFYPILPLLQPQQTLLSAVRFLRFISIIIAKMQQVINGILVMEIQIQQLLPIVLGIIINIQGFIMFCYVSTIPLPDAMIHWHFLIISMCCHPPLFMLLSQWIQIQVAHHLQLILQI